jgi:hypothetical protein
MSVWYYTLLNPFLKQSNPNCVRKIYEAFGRSISEQRLSLLEGRNISFDVRIRLLYALIIFNDLRNADYQDRAAKLLSEILIDPPPFSGLTTFALTRLLILLQEAKRMMGSLETKKEKYHWSVRTFGYLLGSIARGYWEP